MRFGTPQLLERFRDPDGLPSPTASPTLVRLSSESVMLAWAGAANGHWVVRTAPVDLKGVGAVGTIAAPGADALLSSLAPGPKDEALVLWTEPLPTAAGPPDTRRQSIFAARGIDALPNRTEFGEPEEVAPPGPVTGASVALDPSSGRAVAVWQGERASLAVLDPERRGPPMTAPAERAHRAGITFRKGCSRMDRDYELQTHQAEDRHWWYRGRRTVLDGAIAGLGLPRRRAHPRRRLRQRAQHGRARRAAAR